MVSGPEGGVPRRDAAASDQLVLLNPSALTTILSPKPGG